jgi:hypothetical protein
MKCDSGWSGVDLIAQTEEDKTILTDLFLVLKKNDNNDFELAIKAILEKDKVIEINIWSYE